MSVSWGPWPPASGFSSLPFILQFFLFILIIFLAELSAAILAFIFRENVRTGPHALAPCSQPGVSSRHGQPVPSWGHTETSALPAQIVTQPASSLEGFSSQLASGSLLGFALPKTSGAITHLVLESSIHTLPGDGTAVVM